MESKRVKTVRKQFWTEFLLGFGVYCFVVFVFLNELPKFIKILLIISALASFIYAYICGYQAGKEHVNSVLDFIKPNLRWEVRDAEGKMFDKEDKDYNDSL